MSQLGERIAKIEQALIHVEASQAEMKKDISEIKKMIAGDGSNGLFGRVRTLERTYRYVIMALATIVAASFLPFEKVIALWLRVLP